MMSFTKKTSNWKWRQNFYLFYLITIMRRGDTSLHENLHLLL